MKLDSTKSGLGRLVSLYLQLERIISFMSAGFLLLILLGFGIGTLGTLIGAGGGFILVPVLILFYPELGADNLTAISLAVVASNALVGSYAYSKQQRIDYKTGLIFAAATLPGSVLGVMVTKYLPRHKFDMIFGFVFIALSLFLLWRAARKKVLEKQVIKPGYVSRELVDVRGRVYKYSFNMKLGIVLSLFIGFFSPLLGIGGGIIHVPAMSEWLFFPVHVATATSQFVLAIMTVVSVGVHLVSGNYNDPEILKMTASLIVGVIPGALFGANISRRVDGKVIVKVLAIALILVGVRILIGAF